MQVYDGTQGWKLRPFLNRHEVETMTAEELKHTAQRLYSGYTVTDVPEPTKPDQAVEISMRRGKILSCQFATGTLPGRSR